MDLLLFSNSTNHGRSFLAHAEKELSDFLAPVRTLLFVPFAGADHDAYTERVHSALRPFDVDVRGIHRESDPIAALDRADAVFVGGGNTFRLVKALQERGLMGAIAGAVRAGSLRYMGASAGTNIAAPSLRTTNDMPIVEPLSFMTLNLVPFQINPHYIDADPGSTHAGETRETRIREFHEENDIPVIGLREGTHLRITGDGSAVRALIGGEAVGASAPGPAILFRRGQEPREIEGDVTGLM